MASAVDRPAVGRWNIEGRGIVEQSSGSTLPPQSLHAEADGNRTRQGAFAPSPVLKFVAVRAAWCRLVPRRAAELGVVRSFVPSCAVWFRQSPRSSFASRLQDVGTHGGPTPPVSYGSGAQRMGNRGGAPGAMDHRQLGREPSQPIPRFPPASTDWAAMIRGAFRRWYR